MVVKITEDIKMSMKRFNNIRNDAMDKFGRVIAARIPPKTYGTANEALYRQATLKTLIQKCLEMGVNYQFEAKNIQKQRKKKY